MSEFLGGSDVRNETNAPVSPEDEKEVMNEDCELDVQKAVVESLAADKAIRDEEIAKLRRENYALKAEISSLKAKIDDMKSALSKVGDTLARNTEIPISNKVALLDRSMEISDRFEGETRDQVIEALRESRDAAEKEGRVRRAQLLESVLVENEPSGNLEKKRKALEKFFEENENILTGTVIAELQKCGITHKKGEEYLLPREIINRTY